MTDTTIPASYLEYYSTFRDNPDENITNYLKKYFNCLLIE